MQITICVALKELKTLDARIKKQTGEFTPTTFVVGGKLPAGIKSVEDFNEKAKSGLQSIQTLIARRNAIKSAIVKSNAETEVTIGKEKYTVAGAIERKASIEYEKALVKRMGVQLLITLREIQNHNDRVDRELDNHISTILGKDAKEKGGSEVESFTKQFMNTREAKLIDPISAKEEITKMEEAIEDFLANVDTSLSISNATTLIEVV